MEASANTVQSVLPSMPVVFTEIPVGGNSPYIFHRDGSGLFNLASAVRLGCCGFNNYSGCGCFKMPETLYQVAFHGNIAVPTGGTAEAISLAVAIDGIADPSSTMIVTPAAVEEFGNVGADIIVAIPAICGCETVSVINTSTQEILVQNANIILTPVGIRN